MRFRLVSISVLLVCITVQALPQAAFNSGMFTSPPGVEVIQSHTFTEESLYGFIDGGAELYLEYGFDSLVVTDLVCNNADIEAEIYRMKDDEAAFGIFSVSRFRCNGGPKITKHMCRSAYQLQFCKGPFYVSIVNDTGTAADQACANEIASFILAHISEPSFKPDRFYDDQPDDETMRSAVLVRGPLGIFNGIPDLSEIMGQATGYSALIIKKDQKNIASVLFDNEKDASDFQGKRETSVSSDTTLNNSGTVISVLSPKHMVIIF
jgi:hypothetical protein